MVVFSRYRRSRALLFELQREERSTLPPVQSMARSGTYQDPRMSFDSGFRLLGSESSTSALGPVFSHQGGPAGATGGGGGGKIDGWISGNADGKKAKNANVQETPFLTPPRTVSFEVDSNLASVFAGNDRQLVDNVLRTWGYGAGDGCEEESLNTNQSMHSPGHDTMPDASSTYGGMNGHDSSADHGRNPFNNPLYVQLHSQRSSSNASSPTIIFPPPPPIEKLNAISATSSPSTNSSENHATKEREGGVPLYTRDANPRSTEDGQHVSTTAEGNEGPAGGSGAVGENGAVIMRTKKPGSRKGRGARGGDPSLNALSNSMQGAPTSVDDVRAGHTDKEGPSAEDDEDSGKSSRRMSFV